MKRTHAPHIAPKTIPSDSRERAAWVQYQLRLRAISFAEIAKKLGCTRQVLARALQTPMLRQEQAIAEAIDLTPEQLFPERYDGNGRRLHRVRAAA